MSTPPDSLLSVRSALVLLLGVLIGVTAGLLAIDGGAAWQAAVMVGGGACGGAAMLFNSLIN